MQNFLVGLNYTVGSLEDFHCSLAGELTIVSAVDTECIETDDWLFVCLLRVIKLSVLTLIVVASLMLLKTLKTFIFTLSYSF